MSRVQIGHGAIGAAKAVVICSVEPYTVVSGNPARPLRRRFDEATVQALLAITGWDWDSAKITRHLPPIVTADLAALQAAS
ncbi:MAG: CatB-related O-acetyltransferase [Pseudanabaenaceae cyanobacterium]